MDEAPIVIKDEREVLDGMVVTSRVKALFIDGQWILTGKVMLGRKFQDGGWEFGTQYVEDSSPNYSKAWS